MILQQYGTQSQGRRGGAAGGSHLTYIVDLFNQPQLLPTATFVGAGAERLKVDWRHGAGAGVGWAHQGHGRGSCLPHDLGLGQQSQTKTIFFPTSQAAAGPPTRRQWRYAPVV